jgi:hypothetical protein
VWLPQRREDAKKTSPIESLRRIYNERNMVIRAGKYKHYKGKLYEVLGTVRHSETLEELVLYKALYDSPEFGKDQLWVRPVGMFLEKVTVDGKEVPRFNFVED